MITVVVNFDLPPGTTLADATARYLDSSKKYLGAPGLVRKHYLYNAEQMKGGGAYVFETREQAKALFNADWIASITERYGAAPILTYFETPVVVDNVTGEIVS
ncbi:MAG: monooxygenase [Rhodospirillales bacterium CG15_BIG_FIL_POST_REV_8_21_14_020_66_15]|nr:MAG: monooxygenase [Rhodospirillales bacterium CG15_BIG_FIL_POST_REV_8_21_14_020_66_15]